MKIYIEEINPKEIDYKKIEKKLKNDRSFVELYSEEGMHVVENKKMYKIIPTNEKVVKIKENGFTFILDKSKILREECYQVPINHVKINKKKYTIEKTRCIIECIYDENNMKLYIDDFYIEVEDENISIEKIKNEYNVFLLLLN
jgi:hypothetical protein